MEIKGPFKNEKIKHLFFECQFVRAVWAVVQATTGLPQPCSASNMFGSWLRHLSKDFKPLVLLGAGAICWSLWLYRNDIIFERKGVSSPVQVIFSTIHWLRTLGYTTETKFPGFGCGGLSTISAGGQGMFFPRHMGGDLAYALIDTSVSILPLNIIGCVHSNMQRPGVFSCMMIVSTRCNELET